MELVWRHTLTWTQFGISTLQGLYFLNQGSNTRKSKCHWKVNWTFFSSKQPASQLLENCLVPMTENYLFFILCRSCSWLKTSSASLVNCKLQYLDTIRNIYKKVKIYLLLWNITKTKSGQKMATRTFQWSNQNGVKHFCSIKYFCKSI